MQIDQSKSRHKYSRLTIAVGLLTAGSLASAIASPAMAARKKPTTTAKKAATPTTQAPTTAAPTSAAPTTAAAPASTAEPTTVKSAAKPEKQKVKLMVGGLAKVIYLPAKLTEQLGYFKDEGIDVELLDEPAGVDAEVAMLAGEVDGVIGFYDHSIDLQGKGKSVESVVQMSSSPGEVIIVGKDNYSKIKGPADFAGKKMGVTGLGSSTNFLTAFLASTANVGTDKYTPVAVGAGDTFIAALKSGGIDAGMTTEPTISRILKAGDGDILIDMRTPAAAKASPLGGLYPATSLYMATSFVEKNPETVQRLSNAFVRTLHYISSHSPEYISTKMPNDYLVGDPALYISAMKSSIGMFTKDGIMPAGGPENVLKCLSQSDPSVKGHTIDLSKTYTTEFVKKANQKYPA